MIWSMAAYLLQINISKVGFCKNITRYYMKCMEKLQISSLNLNNYMALYQQYEQ